MAPLEALVFRPTLAEVQSLTFEQYVERIEPQLARVGICKIVAPAGWTPRAAGYDGVDYVVPRPVRQMATGARGLFRTCLVEEKAMRVAGRGGFAERASAPEVQAPGGPDADVDVRAPRLAPARAQAVRHEWGFRRLDPPRRRCAPPRPVFRARARSCACLLRCATLTRRTRRRWSASFGKR